MLGDPMLLSEMLSNLVENAIAYCGRGAEATLRVRSEKGQVAADMAETGKGGPSSNWARYGAVSAAATATNPEPGWGFLLSRRLQACSTEPWRSNPPKGPGSLLLLDFL
jgi:two-component system sensor histidine kinase TctE